MWHLGEAFARLQALTDAPVSKVAFENTLSLAFEDCGSVVSMPAERTNAGHDLTIDGVRLSLKTEAAGAINPKRLRISKLMEAAWSKDFGSTADAVASVGRIVAHLGSYERILVLRAFCTDEAITYELVEIPHAVLMRIGSLTADDFSPLTANGSTKALVTEPNCGDNPRQADVQYRLVFDGSANKVSIKSLRKDLCRIHALWIIPRSAPVERI